MNNIIYLLIIFFIIIIINTYSHTMISKKIRLNMRGGWSPQNTNFNTQNTNTNPQNTNTNLQNTNTNLQNTNTNTNLQNTNTNMNLQNTNTNMNLQNTNPQNTKTNPQNTNTNLQNTNTNTNSQNTNKDVNYKIVRSVNGNAVNKKIKIEIDIPKNIPIVNWIKTPFYFPQTDTKHPIAPDQSPTQQLKALIEVFGSPTLIDPTRTGMAVWTRNTLVARGACLERIILSDYQFNFVNMWLFFQISATRGDKKSEQITKDLYDLHPDVFYDEVKHVIDINSNRYEDCLAVLVVAVRFLNEEIHLKQAQNLITTYLDNVNQNSPNYKPNSVSEFKQEICQLKSENDDKFNKNIK